MPPFGEKKREKKEIGDCRQFDLHFVHPCTFVERVCCAHVGRQERKTHRTCGPFPAGCIIPRAPGRNAPPQPARPLCLRPPEGGPGPTVVVKQHYVRMRSHTRSFCPNSFDADACTMYIVFDCKSTTCWLPFLPCAHSLECLAQRVPC